MKITVEYEGQPIVVDIPDETLKKIADSQKKKTGWEKPNHDTGYYCIDSQNDVMRSKWDDCLKDENRAYHGNCFTSKELAENIARYQSLDLRIRRRIAEICEPVIRGIEWRYNIEYNYEDEHCIVHSSAKFAPSHWYCDTRAHAEQIINEFREELMWYFTEFKDRMDGQL